MCGVRGAGNKSARCGPGGCGPPAEPPAEWQATATDYSNAPYPHPVRYLHVRLMGHDHRMARIRSSQQRILFEDPVVHEWQAIATKALVIGGSEDRLVRDFPARARHVAEQLQNAELVLFTGAGHSPHFEIPEAFHAERIRFLRSDPGLAP